MKTHLALLRARSNTKIKKASPQQTRITQLQKGVKKKFNTRRSLFVETLKK
jgi:hypothetical protein